MCFDVKGFNQGRVTFEEINGQKGGGRGEGCLPSWWDATIEELYGRKANLYIVI